MKPKIKKERKGKISRRKHANDATPDGSTGPTTTGRGQNRATLKRSWSIRVKNWAKAKGDCFATTSRRARQKEFEDQCACQIPTYIREDKKLWNSF